jgi:uncharacterized protein with GYD domain
VIFLIFITLIKWKKAPSKATQTEVDEGTRMKEEWEKQGIKMNVYWTLGRYDAVWIMEAPTEKEAMKRLLVWQDIIETETMVAIPREEAIKLL